jgi:hypothetical protein
MINHRNLICGAFGGLVFIGGHQLGVHIGLNGAANLALGFVVALGYICCIEQMTTRARSIGLEEKDGALVFAPNGIVRAVFPPGAEISESLKAEPHLFFMVAIAKRMEEDGTAFGKDLFDWLKKRVEGQASATAPIPKPD